MKQIKLYYDDDCPFCKEYSKYIEIKKKYDIKILNARDHIDKMKYFREKGLDINEGMIIEIDDHDIYQGADAASILDKAIEHSNFIDKSISLFLKLPGFKAVIYPIIKIFRIVVLKIMGKNPNLKY